MGLPLCRLVLCGCYWGCWGHSVDVGQRVFTRLEMEVGECVVACTFKNVVDGFEWTFAGVYGLNGDFDRCLLWDELDGLLSWWNLPWCIVGDFNVIRFLSERSGGRRISSAMRKFSNFIFERGLMALPLTRGLCTWSNSRS
jgi:hypothetical protein